MAEGATLITGSASGIGQATARLLLASGTSVIGIDKDIDGQKPVSGDNHARFTFIRADVTDADAIDRAIAAAVSRGPVCGLVNCAGIYPVTPMLDMATSEWDDVLSVNLRAPFLVTRALARHWAASGITPRSRTSSRAASPTMAV